MHALEDEEASVVVPLFQLMPVFGYIIAYVVLGEVLSWQKIFAGCVVVFGAVVLSLEFSEERKISLKKKTLIFMIFSTFLIALSDVLFKWAAIESGGFWSSTFWNYSGLVIVGVIMFCFIKTYRKEFISLLKSSGKNIISLNVASEFTTIVGNITFSFATLLAPIALVMTVASYQPVFVFLLGIILTIFLPGVITEKISSRHLLHKGIAIGIILVGSYLVNTV
jgi:drug/metabolite transporter (DMT)-like permease